MFYNEETSGEFYGGLVFGLHTVYMFVACCVVGGFDCLFFYLLGHAVSELKMLTFAFSDKEIGKKWSCEERFKYSVKHHIQVFE